VRFKYLREPNRRKFEGAKNEQKLVSAVFISLLALIYLRQRRGFWAIYADRPYILGSSDIPAASVAKPIDISKKGNKADFLARIEKSSYP